MLVIDAESSGQRLDNFLGRVLKGVPKTHVYRIIRSGEVRVNRRRAGPDYRLAEGDAIRVPPVRESRSPGRAPAAPPLLPPVLHEDDDVLVLAKPAGLAVHGGSGIAHGLIERLRAARPEARFLELVHRLDRETSGILLVAKRRPALVALHGAFRAGEIDKRYRVMVRGLWIPPVREVTLALARRVTAEGERRVRVEADTGAEARTTFRREGHFSSPVGPLSLLEARIHTGRTHQIRVHAAHLRHPVAGDDKYGDFDWNRSLARIGLKRMFLHASRMELAHPSGVGLLSLEMPLPEELAGFLASLAPLAAPDEGRRRGTDP